MLDHRLSVWCRQVVADKLGRTGGRALTLIRLPAGYYQQFDADFALPVPGEGYGGWQRADIEIAPEHTALVVMHAYDCGRPEEYPGWHRAVEYIPRAHEISRSVFPPLLTAVRSSPLAVFHVVGGGAYYQDLPGYQRTVAMAEAEPPLAQVPRDAVRMALDEFRSEHVFPGNHNRQDIGRGVQHMDFLPEARPLATEGIAATTAQLYALCRQREINHLIYIGFAINWCLLLSPGGMAAMQRHGLLCSTIRQAVTAVENRETTREQGAKEIALWRVALAFGFVFDAEGIIAALNGPLGAGDDAARATT